jgi:hypothetical protein
MAPPPLGHGMPYSIGVYVYMLLDGSRLKDTQRLM